MFQVRTDLALEERERIREDQADTGGIRMTEEEFPEEGIKMTNVWVETEQAAKVLGKPPGIYITLEADAIWDDRLEEEADWQTVPGSDPVADHLAAVLRKLVSRRKKQGTVLVAGLGNRSVTPDALGPRVADHLCITRHLEMESRDLGKYKEADNMTISALTPGVMAQTGMESSEIIAGVIRQTHPDCLIVVDALAARNFERLGRTIQITDTGIHPGSGVGNHRHEITQESVGIPVIAIGIPTVVETAAIVQDTMDRLIGELAQAESMRQLQQSWRHLDESEHRELVRELLPDRLNTMFVTPKDIDAQIRRMSGVVAAGINRAFLPV